jgi:hypothetical protein
MSLTIGQRRYRLRKVKSSLQSILGREWEVDGWIYRWVSNETKISISPKPGFLHRVTIQFCLFEPLDSTLILAYIEGGVNKITSGMEAIDNAYMPDALKFWFIQNLDLFNAK